MTKSVETTDATDLHGLSRRGFISSAGKVGVFVVATLSGTLTRPDPARAHNDDCDLFYSHNPYCAYNCWRYPGYNSHAWISDSGHNWCFECTTGPTCRDPSYLCSQYGHM